MLRFLKKILQLAINPAKGWEDVSYDNDDPSELCRKGFYPLLAICALSCFVLMLRYGGGRSLVEVIERAIVVFTSYFAGYFLSEYIMEMFLPKYSDKEPSLRRDSTFVLCILSLMAVIEIISNLLPANSHVWFFLLLFVPIVIYRADRYLGIRQQDIGPFMLTAVFGVMVPPYLLQFIFKFLLG